MQAYLTTLFFTDDQFLKMKLNSGGDILFMKVVQTRPTKRIHKSQVKASVARRMFEDETWRADVLAGMLHNLILDASRKWADAGADDIKTI